MSRADRKEATRASILKLAKELFDEDGFEATTIRGLATRLGMSTGAVFAHFTGKEELYLTVMGHDVVTPEAGVALRTALADLVADLDQLLVSRTGTGLDELQSLDLARELVGIMEPKKAVRAA